MQHYDLIVIGSGCGAVVYEEAVAHGKKVAIVDKGPLGGTCPNLGCIPSKMLIYAADRVMDIREAGKLGIDAEVKGVDFAAIMARMRKSVGESLDFIRGGLKATEGLHLYEGLAQFAGDRTLEVMGERIQGDAVVIASGSRPAVPPIKGLDGVPYWTSEDVLAQEERPGSLIIIGGGYIAVEYGHFFAAMGARVTILEMADRLTLAEEPEVAALLQTALARRMEVLTGIQVEEVRREADGRVTVTAKTSAGAPAEFGADRLLIAAGRRSNADLLKLENTGVEVDQRGFIKVNERLETTRPHVWAVGDINGLQMFTHAGNRQAALVADSILHGEKGTLDPIVPHAVYSRPQIASVGLTEERARKDYQVAIGRARYGNVAKGEAMMEQEGFAKAVADKKDGKLLGFHIIGPFAPELIQEVTNAMAAGGDPAYAVKGMHIHPALNELIQATLANVE